MKDVLTHAASAAAGAAAVLIFTFVTGTAPDSTGADQALPARRAPAGPEGARGEAPSVEVEELRAEKEGLAERGRQLETELEAARAELEEARRRLAAQPATDGALPAGGPGAGPVRIRTKDGAAASPAGGPAGEDPGAEGEEPALPRFKRYVVFGEGLTDEAARKLGLTEDERARVDGAIAGEEPRLHAALDQFARDSRGGLEGPRPGESTAAALTRLMHEAKIGETAMKFHEENPDAMQMLRDGRLSMRDVLGEDSDAYRLLSAMREARRQTHEDVEGILDAERAATFANDIHPPGSYAFKGNMNLMMGGPLTPEEAAEAAARRQSGK